MNIVQFMDKFPIGYQLSTCPLVPMIKLLKRRIIRYMMSCFFFFFFCKQFFFCVFSREFQHNSIKSVQCVPLDFLRDHRRTSPFSNLFKGSSQHKVGGEWFEIKLGKISRMLVKYEVLPIPNVIFVC